MLAPTDSTADLVEVAGQVGSGWTWLLVELKKAAGQYAISSRRRCATPYTGATHVPCCVCHNTRAFPSENGRMVPAGPTKNEPTGAEIATTGLPYGCVRVPLLPQAGGDKPGQAGPVYRIDKFCAKWFERQPVRCPCGLLTAGGLTAVRRQQDLAVPAAPAAGARLSAHFSKILLPRSELARPSMHCR